MLIKLFIIVFLAVNLALAQNDSPCPTDRADYFCISPDMAPNSQIDIVKFFTIPAQIIQLFQNELSQKSNPLVLNADWESPFFGSGISLYQDQFRLMILGGTSRIDGLTPDAYAAIVCHELGHLIAGAPYQTIQFAEWASAEGQADFFAASVCLRKYFKSFSESTAESQNQINARVEQAGFQMIKSFYSVFKEGNEPVRYKADTTKVTATLINNYPPLQCRYENFRNPTVRPACWYKPE